MLTVAVLAEALAMFAAAGLAMPILFEVIGVTVRAEAMGADCRVPVMELC